jgi:hypothetical protein
MVTIWPRLRESSSGLAARYEKTALTRRPRGSPPAPSVEVVEEEEKKKKKKKKRER